MRSEEGVGVGLERWEGEEVACWVQRGGLKGVVSEEVDEEERGRTVDVSQTKHVVGDAMYA